MDLKRIFLVICVMAYASHAYAAKFTITADYKRYDSYRQALIAKGNVTVKAKDFSVRSPYVIVYYRDDKIVAMDKFTLQREGYKITGSTLEYFPYKGIGNAERVRIDFGETFLGARYMTMDGDKFELYDASFSGCDDPTSPHYHFSAQNIALYPNTGLIVAYYTTCYVWIAPVIPVPTFVYSAPVPKSKFRAAKQKETPPKNVKERTEGIKTTQPIPEIGSNPADGNFIRQGFNWYFNPRSYLKTRVSYMEKNRLGGSVAANYILNNENEGEIRLGSNEEEKAYGGITHYLSFGNKLLSKSDEEWLKYDYYKPGGKYAYELELKHSYRERINHEENIGPFSRVSFAPMVTLRANRQPVPLVGGPFTYFMEASFANVSEEVHESETTFEAGYVTSSPRRNYFADITCSQDLGWFGDLSLIYDITLSDYEKLGSWDRARQQVMLEQEFFDKLTLSYGQIHYMMQRGSSPYLFESYYYAPYDTFVGGLKLKAWFSYFKFKAAYNLPSWDPYDIYYQWLLGMHCYNLIFEYNVFRKEFNFSFELVPSRW